MYYMLVNIHSVIWEIKSFFLFNKSDDTRVLEIECHLVKDDGVYIIDLNESSK